MRRRGKGSPAGSDRVFHFIPTQQLIYRFFFFFSNQVQHTSSHPPGFLTPSLWFCSPINFLSHADKDTKYLISGTGVTFLDAAKQSQPVLSKEFSILHYGLMSQQVPQKGERQPVIQSQEGWVVALGKMLFSYSLFLGSTAIPSFLL